MGSVLLIYLGFLYCVFALFVFVLCHVPKCCLFGSPPVLNTEVHFVHFVLLCVFTFLVPCCGVRYNVRIKTMFGSSLPLVACKRNHVLLCFFCMFAYSEVQHFVLSYVFTYWVPCSHDRYDFRIETMFTSSLGRLMSYLRYLCLYANSGVQ